MSTGDGANTTGMLGVRLDMGGLPLLQRVIPSQSISLHAGAYDVNGGVANSSRFAARPSLSPNPFSGAAFVGVHRVRRRSRRWMRATRFLNSFFSIARHRFPQ